MHFNVALQDTTKVPYRDYVSFDQGDGVKNITVLHPKRGYRFKLLSVSNMMLDITHVTYNHATGYATAYNVDQEIDTFNELRDIPVVIMEDGNYRAFI